MSRLGKKPVDVPSDVKVSINGREVNVEGKLGKLQFIARPEVKVLWNESEKQIVIERANDSRPARAYHGMTRALIANMITGVKEGFKIELEIVGVGWNAQLKGKTVALTVGYADVREVNVLDGVNVEIKGQKLTITGCDKQKVGQLAARIRSQRPPEPYNGKGIKYSDEVIVRKEGKAFAGGG